MSRSALLLGAMTLLVASCERGPDPFDATMCQLEVETRLSSGLSERAFGISDGFYLELEFDSRSADLELLGMFMRQKGYFGVASAPDPAFEHVRVYSFHGSEDERPRMPELTSASAAMCQAADLTGAKPIAVAVMSGQERVWKAEIR